MRKIILCTWYFFTLSLLFSSCEKPVTPVTESDSNREPVLSLSTDTVTLLQRQSYETAFTLEWTSGTNRGTGSAMSYTVEMDLSGNNFDGGAKWNIGKTSSRTLSFTHAQMNDTLLACFNGLEYGRMVNLDFRVKATVLITGEVQTSEVVTLAVAPYEKHVLYMVGDATPNGWSREENQVITILSDPEDTCLYRWSGRLKAGSFKFLKSRTSDDWLPAYLADPSDAGRMVYVASGSYDDNQWRITAEGNYTIELNTRDLTIFVRALSADEEPEPEMYIIGSATEGGWDMALTRKMTMYLVGNDTVFRWSGMLYYHAGDDDPGAFKFLTTPYGWTPCYVADGSDPTHMHYREDDSESAPPDLKWHITVTAPYSIEANISTMTLTITRTGDPVEEPVYRHLYMVGDATPGGWSLDNATELTADEEDGNIFRWTGTLTAGTLKFTPQKNSFDGLFLFAPDYDAPPALNGTFESGLGNEHPDMKWKISEEEAGTYSITISISAKTISFVKL